MYFSFSYFSLVFICVLSLNSFQHWRRESVLLGLIPTISSKGLQRLLLCSEGSRFSKTHPIRPGLPCNYLPCDELKTTLFGAFLISVKSLSLCQSRNSVLRVENTNTRGRKSQRYYENSANHICITRATSGAEHVTREGPKLLVDRGKKAQESQGGGGPEGNKGINVCCTKCSSLLTTPHWKQQEGRTTGRVDVLDFQTTAVCCS